MCSLRSKIFLSVFCLLGMGENETEGGYMRFTSALGPEGVDGNFRFSSAGALEMPDFATALNGVTNFGLAMAIP